jgi:hypothetical protein
MAAKTVGDAIVSQSTAPSAATSATVRPSPIVAYAPMGANPSIRF